MLNITKVELEKDSNPDIHLFIERGMKGGISYINKQIMNIAQIMIKINQKFILMILI